MLHSLLVLGAISTGVSTAGLVDILYVDPTVQIESIHYTFDKSISSSRIRYYHPLYPLKDYTGISKPCQQTMCLLQEDVAAALKLANQELRMHGLSLLILVTDDSFKKIVPEESTEQLRHLSGVAVDCTIIDSGSGLEQYLGTDFNNFTSVDLKHLNEQATSYRTMLTSIMKKHGFEATTKKWWHFDIKNWQSYPIVKVDEPEKRLLPIFRPVC